MEMNGRAQTETTSNDVSTPLSQRVITEVAKELDADPLEIEPLYNVIDPDALNQLFESPARQGTRRSGQVTFTLAGCEVSVHSEGSVEVTPLEDHQIPPKATGAEEQDVLGAE